MKALLLSSMILALISGCAHTRNDSTRIAAELRVVCSVELTPGVALPDMPPPQAQACAGARVEVRDASGTIIASGSTDSDGVYATPLEPGTYTIHAHCLDVHAEPRTVVITAATVETELTLRFTTAAP